MRFSQSQGPGGGGGGLWGGVATTVLRKEGEGNHTSACSAGCHGSNGCPGVRVGAVDLGSVEVDLPIMPPDSKEVATES